VRRRLNRVPASAQALLQAAAVAGRQIDPVMLQVIAPATSIESWLAACSDASVLQFQDNQWRYSHDKLREGVLDELDEDHRRELHTQVARAIEQCYLDDLAHAPALAGHWREAGDVLKEAHYAGLAGEQASATGANLEATQFLARADDLA